MVQSQCIHGALSGDARECRPRFSERAKSSGSGRFCGENNYDPRASAGAVSRGILQYSESHQFHYSKPRSLQQRPYAIETNGITGDFSYRRRNHSNRHHIAAAAVCSEISFLRGLGDEAEFRALWKPTVLLCRERWSALSKAASVVACRTFSTGVAASL